MRVDLLRLIGRDTELKRSCAAMAASMPAPVPSAGVGPTASGSGLNSSAGPAWVQRQGGPAAGSGAMLSPTCASATA